MRLYVCKVDTQNFAASIMKHPCTACIFLAFGVALLCWTLSHTILASRSFPRRSMQIFPVSSYVTDIYNGSLETLQVMLRKSDLRFVVFYAPWCAQSRKMVPQVSNAAMKLKNQVSFIAINCWIGSCRTNFTLPEFPKFYAYHTIYAPVEFMEPPDYWRILQFLKSMVRPFYYLGNEQHFIKLRESNRAIVVGYFNMKNEFNKKFSIFLELCITNINRVSKQLYGVVTNSKMAAIAGLRKYGEIIMHQVLGDRMYFPDISNFTAEEIFSWILKNQVTYVTQLTPNMTYLDKYINELKRGPAVLLFISFNPKFKKYTNDVIRQYHQLAAQYNNCSEFIDPKHILSTIERYSEQSFINETLYKHSVGLCVSFSKSTTQINCSIDQNFKASKFHSRRQLDINFTKNLHSKGLLQSYQQKQCVCLRPLSYYCSDPISMCCMLTTLSENPGKTIASDNKIDLDHLLGNDLLLEDTLTSLSAAIDSFFNTTVQQSSGKSSYTTLLQRKLTDQSSKNSVPVPFLAKDTQEPRVEKSSEEPDKSAYERNELNLHRTHLKQKRHGNFSYSDFNGLRCKTNRTVNFFYLDYEMHGTIIRGLGIDQKLIQNRTSLALVDLKNEATYVLKESLPVSSTTVVEFITNFTNGRLERRLRSSKVSNQCSDGDVCITEVTTNTFENIVLNDSKDVLLMYYAPWCGYCKHGYRAILQLAKSYGGADSLEFARINADENDLPYHFTVDGYPTFILFPRTRKSYSHVYPDDQPMNQRSMEKFLIKYCSNRTRKYIESIINDNR